MRNSTKLILIISALGLVVSPPANWAATLTTTNVQGSGANWTAAIWKTNGTGTAAAPVAGNTYSEIFNGVLVGNALNNTRVRNPAVAGTQTFPGDSLTLKTNTELRAKQSGATLNFPGVGGNPGLILDGGMLNGGDDATFPITGNIQVLSPSYISHGAGGGGGAVSVNRAFNISGVLSGPGTMVILNSGTTIAQQISGNSNAFSGQWIVQCGWLQGTGIDSLGTNSITVDPQYLGYQVAMPSALSQTGPAWFEPRYDMNSAGALTLVNGGILRLHQDCVFSSVVIEGTPLSPGFHTYSELSAAYSGNIAANGSGSLTVRPYSLAPLVVRQPQAQFVYAGSSARFTVRATGAAPLTYQWRKDTVALADEGNVSGSTTPTLVLNNVSAGDLATYDVVVSNPAGSATSSGGVLTLVSPSETYETAVAGAHPAAFYQFNETGDPAASGLIAMDNAGGFNATYGAGVQNGNAIYGITGPAAADGYPGFAAGNKAAAFFNLIGSSAVTSPSWNPNTNAVTLTAWIKPAGVQNPSAGIIFCRGGDTVAGLNYTANLDGLGSYTLGYTWNNESETYTWNSGISAPNNIWSFVALVITPADATLYLMNTNGIVSSTHTYPHVIQSFNGTTLIGDDSNDGGNGQRVFAGMIDDVAVFNWSMAKSDVLGLFTAATGINAYGPIIVNSPASLNLYAGQTARFAVAAGGSDPLTYQWQKAASGSGLYANLVDGGQVSGAQTGVLTVNNISTTDAADFIVIVANTSGSVTSSVAILNVFPTSPAQNITMTIQQATGTDWDATGAWSDGNPASVSAVINPGSTYELLPGARMRTPGGPRTANFPGNVLKVDGNGLWINNPGAGTAMAEIRFKQPFLGVGNGAVSFKQLIMNGGQLDVGSVGVVEIGGEIDILTNTPFYNDSTVDEGYLVSAWLTGGSSSSIEYHGYNLSAFQTGYSNNLNIAGTSNSFAGKWNVVLGTLLGTGPGSLGTNDISVAANGALETTYDINNTTASLFLNGRMFLHQNDTFKSLFVSGVPLNPGTYTFEQLNPSYPSNFPASWTPQNGAAAFSTGSGSITVLVQPAPTISQQPQSLSLYPGQRASFIVQAQGNPPLGFRWRNGNTFLSDTAALAGSGSSNLIISSVTPADAGNYTVVVTNSIGSVTSVVAVLTVLPTGPALNLTLDYGATPIVQPAGSDWNTLTNWSDGNAASVSVYANPGSTYEVVVGSRLRPPFGTNYAAFPGDVLTVDGDSLLENGALTAVGEFRFKHPDPGTNYFKKLVMKGGQLDNGDNGLIVVQGEIDILANTPIYVDSGAGVDRSVQIDAWLTGSADILWHQWGASLGGPCLNITGVTNLFSGKWTVEQGTLVGSGTKSLGTNDMAVAAAGALETLYDINNPSGSLTLDGQMFLHQNDTFKQVTVASTPLTPGTYTFAQLSGAYPANFPGTWVQQVGSTYSAASGSITVLGDAPPRVSLQTLFSGGNLQLTWSQGTLLEANDVMGPWTTNLAASPFTVLPTEARKFYRVQVR